MYHHFLCNHSLVTVYANKINSVTNIAGYVYLKGISKSRFLLL